MIAQEGTMIVLAETSMIAPVGTMTDPVETLMIAPVGTMIDRVETLMIAHVVISVTDRVGTLMIVLAVILMMVAAGQNGHLKIVLVGMIDRVVSAKLLRSRMGLAERLLARIEATNNRFLSLNNPTTTLVVGFIVFGNNDFSERC